jgi:hypothetical protein
MQDSQDPSAFPWTWLAALALVAPSCHAPVAAGGEIEPNSKPELQAMGYQQPDDGFDLFEDEDANSSNPGVPFDQASLDARVAEILPRVEELRGMKFRHAVPAGLQSPDQFIEFAIADFDAEYGLDAFAATSEAYRLLGLIEPDMDLFETTMNLLREQVGGYYDPKTKRFYMIDSFKQGAMADIILAHELTHALDDQHYDLQKIMQPAKTNADTEFAIRAVVEGSGTSLMNLFAIQGMMQGWLKLDAAEMMAMMGEQAESMREAPPYLIMTLALPYLEGNKLLTRQSETMASAMAVPTAEDLAAAFENPPLSSEQVLHFEKYWDPAQLDEPTALDLPDLSSGFGEGWKLQDRNVLGELGCFVLTAESLPDLSTAEGQMAGTWTNQAATGWDGDLYQSYLGPDGQRILLWVSFWDSALDAEEFFEAYEQMGARQNQYLNSIKLHGAYVIASYCSETGLAELATAQADAVLTAEN